MKNFKLLALCIPIVMTMAACRGDLSTSIWAARAGTGAVQAVGQIDLPDGVYSGVGTGGFGGDLYVDVTIRGNAITEITVTAHSETPAFAASVFSALIPEIMLRQATGVDTIAGATMTADALIGAVEDALVSAGADLTAVRLGAAPLSFIAGTFSGVGTGGFGGNIYVDVTFSENSILSVTVTAHNETPAFANSVFGHLIPAILANNTANLDTVAGATETAEALLHAVQDAIEQARD